MPATDTLPARPDRVDTHFHVFRAHEAVPGARYVPAYSAALSTWQRLAAASGIGRGVLVQPSFLGTDNRLLLQCLEQYPEALRGIAVVSPDITLASLAQLHAAGVRGLRLNLAGQSHDLSAWQGSGHLWSWLVEAGWHLELHTDQGALPGVLGQLPRTLPVVIDHMGKPERCAPDDPSLQAARQWAAHAPVWVKLSGAYRLGGVPAPALAQLWLQVLGPQQLLWGSDWPCTNHESQADYASLWAQLDSWVGALADTVARDNPARLYWGAMT